MGRLIDADLERSRIAVVLKESGEGADTKIFSGNDLIKILNNAPTAYDVDKVVEQMEVYKNSEHADGYEFIINDLIDIVQTQLNWIL